MKRILKIVAGIFSFFLILILSIVLVFFVNPSAFINEGNLKWAIDTFGVFESWSWKKFSFEHDWKKWNDRRFTGEIRDFCFVKDSPGTKIDSCFSEISWDFDLLFSFSSVETKTYKPFLVESLKFDIFKSEAPPVEDEESSPPDIYGYWKLLWSGMIPDLRLDFKSIRLITKEKTTELDFLLLKEAKKLRAEAMKYVLTANPEGFELRAPAAIEVPEKLDTVGPFYLRDVLLKGNITENNIPLHLTGSLEEAGFDVTASVPLPLPDDPAGADFRVKVLSSIKGEVKIPEFQKAYSRRAPAAFRELPAPLNVMDGTIFLKFHIDPGEENEVRFNSVTRIDMKSKKEVLDLNISADVDLPVMTFKPESIIVGLEFNEVKLLLPKLSKKSPPPQFVPDKRFKKGPWKPPEEKKKTSTELLIQLEASEKKSLHIVSNLLDEALRLNFKLDIGNEGVEDGFVNLLPLETTVFKRPVHVKKLVVTFNRPEEPVIDARIVFPLPEYKITMNLEGPVSGPRYSFKSDPPLPQNDIYAVLLFGRPMADLNPDDKTAASKTNQILANGVLSLSVLYFLSGSPVEYVGFDPNSGTATAQFGLTKKTSLRVGGGQEGMNSTGLRHSLGKGWYIDTSVQDTQERATSDDNNYGVLIERVIAY